MSKKILIIAVLNIFFALLVNKTAIADAPTSKSVAVFLQFSPDTFRIKANLELLKRMDKTADTCIPCRKNKIFCLCILTFKVEINAKIAFNKDNVTPEGYFAMTSDSARLILDLDRLVINKREIRNLFLGADYPFRKKIIIEDTLFLKGGMYEELVKAGYKGKSYISSGVYYVHNYKVDGVKTARIEF